MSAPSFAIMSPRYTHWLSTMKIEKASEFSVAAKTIAKNKSRYTEVCTNLGLAESWWTLIGAIHYRESDCNFRTHLANGDPLTHKTRHVPAGGPPGTPPFKWEYSAEWSLKREGAQHLPKEFNVESALYFAEAYNGWGYEMKGHPSSYLWAGTSISPRGKFIGDGHWSAAAIDEQPGVVGMLKALGALDHPVRAPVVAVAVPKAPIVAPVAPKPPIGLVARVKAWFSHAPADRS